jgi:hypothetical protein
MSCAKYIGTHFETLGWRAWTYAKMNRTARLLDVVLAYDSAQTLDRAIQV